MQLTALVAAHIQLPFFYITCAHPRAGSTTSSLPLAHGAPLLVASAAAGRLGLGFLFGSPEPVLTHKILLVGLTWESLLRVANTVAFGRCQ